MTLKGPSEHLGWNELACWNRSGHVWNGFAPGELIAAYPREWRDERAVRLAATFEDIRVRLGNQPLTINSAYRTSAYNRLIGGAPLSQHVMGRALDIRHPKLKSRDVFDGIRAMFAAGKLPFLGGIGLYPTFVHFDIRPRTSGRLAVWSGSGEGV